MPLLGGAVGESLVHQAPPFASTSKSISARIPYSGQSATVKETRSFEEEVDFIVSETLKPE
jgi:hypothetical protein